MKSSVPFLKKGDLIEILSPAKSIETAHVAFAKNLLEENGFRVKVGQNCLGKHHYFSGTSIERLSDFQKALDNEEVKAILCARGGYGSVQIVDKIGWASFLRSPKWIIGFSDVTVFHQKVAHLNLQSIHATMPLNFETNTKKSITTLIQTLTGQLPPLTANFSKGNKLGEASGKLIGGNLSILYSLLASKECPDYSNTILFIEDLAEQLYHLDRIFYAFEKAGVLDKINGLVVGGMTNMQDTQVPFGKTVEEIILSHFQYRKIPICFNFPAGHIDDNQALLLGKEVLLSVKSDQAEIIYL